MSTAIQEKVKSLEEDIALFTLLANRSKDLVQKSHYEKLIAKAKQDIRMLKERKV